MGYHSRGPSVRERGQKAGRIDYLCEIITTAKPQVDGGAVKALAIMAPQRSPVLPNLPTAAEEGTPVEAYTWNAIFLPKGAPADAVTKLNDAIVKAMDTPAVRDRLTLLGANLVAPERRSPEYLAKFVNSEIEKWAVPIKASGASIE